MVEGVEEAVARAARGVDAAQPQCRAADERDAAGEVVDARAARKRLVHQLALPQPDAPFLCFLCVLSLLLLRNFHASRGVVLGTPPATNQSQSTTTHQKASECAVAIAITACPSQRW